MQYRSFALTLWLDAALSSYASYRSLSAALVALCIHARGLTPWRLKDKSVEELLVPRGPWLAVAHASAPRSCSHSGPSNGSAPCYASASPDASACPPPVFAPGPPLGALLGSAPPARDRPHGPRLKSLRTPARPHTRTPAHPHTRTPAHPQTRTHAHPHTRTPAHSQDAIHFSRHTKEI